MNKEPYTPPSIRRVSQGTANPQRLGRVPVMDSIDGVPVDDLIRQHGSPLFVFSESNLRDKIREAREAFESVYPEVQFAWSYKTNYLNAICRLFHQEGSIAEVVSGFEYEKARSNGMPGHQIIFNGPWKDPKSLRRAVEEGAMIQIDNRDEMLALARIAEERGADLPVGVRIHVDTGTHAVWSKFGFSVEDGEALRVIRWMRDHTRLKVRGIHCHAGTFLLDANAYVIATERVVELAVSSEESGAGVIEYLNLGGGFASHARLHGQYLPPEQATPTFDAYAEAICGTIKRHWPGGRKLPKLYLETGRALVDEAGYLVSSVVAVKQRSMGDSFQPLPAYGKGAVTSANLLGAYGKGAVPPPAGSRRNAVVLDVGVNLLYTSTWYQPTIHPVSRQASQVQPTTVYGCLCMNIDVIREEAPLPELRAGDAVVLHPVGAYNLTQSMQFITYRPSAVMIDPDCGVHLIRRREVLEDVQGPEEIPSHLQEIDPAREASQAVRGGHPTA